jgi:hypothetical protein
MVSSSSTVGGKLKTVSQALSPHEQLSPLTQTRLSVLMRQPFYDGATTNAATGSGNAVSLADARVSFAQQAQACGVEWIDRAFTSNADVVNTIAAESTAFTDLLTGDETPRCKRLRKELASRTAKHGCRWPTRDLAPGGAPFSFFHLYHNLEGQRAMYLNSSTVWPTHIGGTVRDPCDVSLAWFSDALGPGTTLQKSLSEYAPLLLGSASQSCLRGAPFIAMGSWKLDKKGQPLPCVHMRAFNWTVLTLDGNESNGGGSDGGDAQIVTWSASVQQKNVVKALRKVRRRIPRAFAAVSTFFRDVLGAPASFLAAYDSGVAIRRGEALQTNIIASSNVYDELRQLVVVMSVWLHAVFPDLPLRCMDMPKQRWARCLCYPLESAFVIYVRLTKHTLYIDPNVRGGAVERARLCDRPEHIERDASAADAARIRGRLHRAYAAIMWRHELQREAADQLM